MRKGVVAVVVRDQKWLVIQRSQFVSAPGHFCFPGGGVDDNEDEPTAVVRELSEELGLLGIAVAPLFRSKTPWKVELTWWSVSVSTEAVPMANPEEIAAFEWMDPHQLIQLKPLLPSNSEFYHAWMAGQFEIPGLSRRCT